jgi:SAM-dependent methyltransferase
VPVSPFVNPNGRHLIIALDLSDEELRHNQHLNHKIVPDAAALGFPFRDGTADIVVSRVVIEHIRDDAAFFENCARMRRPGAIMLPAFRVNSHTSRR